jgi:hypothetical protein
MHVDEPCTASLFTLSLIVLLLLYMFMWACMCAELRDACVGMGIVVLGVCGVKTGRRRRFGYFGGGELETTDLGSGIGVHSSVHPSCYGFRSLGVGVLRALGGHELAPV